jgi:rRNA maturation endonuclease Nob1
MKRQRRLTVEPRPVANDTYQMRVSCAVGFRNGVLIMTPPQFARVCKNCSASVKQDKCEYCGTNQ